MYSNAAFLGIDIGSSLTESVKHDAALTAGIDVESGCTLDDFTFDSVNDGCLVAGSFEAIQWLSTHVAAGSTVAKYLGVDGSGRLPSVDVVSNVKVRQVRDGVSTPCWLLALTFHDKPVRRSCAVSMSLMPTIDCLTFI